MSQSFYRDDSVTMVDKQKEIKNILTDFVVHEYLKDSDKLCSFITFVYITFNEAIHYYNQFTGLNSNQLFFVYKGGNVLRLVYDQAFYMLPGEAKESIFNYYSDSFKRSDADFSIYLDPSIPHYTKVFNQMTIMAYYLQNYIRLHFLQDPGKWFDYYNLSDRVKQSLLHTYLTKINETGTNYQLLTLPSIQLPYYPRKDTLLTFRERSNVIHSSSNAKLSLIDSTNLQPVHLAEHNNPSLDHFARMSGQIYGDRWASEMVISVNETTTFRANNHLVSFNLVRTKVSFNLIHSTHDISIVGGELIDVSIPHESDDNIAHFFQNVSTNIVTYTKLGTNCDLSFRSYSVGYLIADLENILFSSSKYPWDNPKYAKRMKRLIFLYYLSLFIEPVFKTNRERINYLQLLKVSVLQPLQNIQTTICTNDSCSLNADTDKIQSFIRMSALHYPQFSGFTHLIDKIIVLHTDPRLSLPDYNQFLGLVLENVQVLQASLTGLQNYIHLSGHIEEESIYEPV